MPAEKAQYHCALCVLNFHSVDGYSLHMKQLHPKKQELACPGCYQTFERAGALMQHIENNQCKRITKGDLEARREEHLAFSRELQRRHFGDAPSSAPLDSTRAAKPPSHFGQYLSNSTSVGAPTLSALRPKAEATVRPNPVTLAIKEVAPDASAAITQGQQKTWPEHHPKNPQFRAANYFSPYSKKWKCPHARCPKSFPSEQGFVAHLLSPTHQAKVKVQCPHCQKWFDSTAALTQHAESEGVRCNIRETESYRVFLDQLTAGMVDTKEKHEDGTLKYEVSKEAWAIGGMSREEAIKKETELQKAYWEKHKPKW